MATVSNFRKLDAWRAARRLVKEVYAFTDRFPGHERYCLTQQMRRAVHSIHSNIAEGDGRLSTGEWIHFLGQARGSIMELESDVIVAFDLGYCERAATQEIGLRIRQVAQLINGTLRSAMRGKFNTKKFG